MFFVRLFDFRLFGFFCVLCLGWAAVCDCGTLSVIVCMYVLMKFLFCIGVWLCFFFFFFFLFFFFFFFLF